MFNQLAHVDMSIYVQTVLFIIFMMGMLRLQWKIGSVAHLLASSVRYVLLLLVFTYLFLNWASDVNPSLRNSSLIIMTFINIYMFWHLIVSALELPYRKALANCVEGLCTATDLERVFSTGKRFYKFRYFWASLTSGTTPWRFLRGMSAERTRDDLHRVFVSLDPKASVFGASLYAHFLRYQLDADKKLSAEAKAECGRFIGTLDSNAWIEEKTGEFLNNLLTAPEALQESGLKAMLKDSGKLA